MRSARNFRRCDARFIGAWARGDLLLDLAVFWQNSSVGGP